MADLLQQADIVMTEPEETTVDKLNNLKKLLSKGLITPEDYEKKSASLSDRFMTETAPAMSEQEMRDEIINNIIPQFNQSAIEAGNIDPIGTDKLGDMVASLKFMSGRELHQTYQTMMRNLNTQRSASRPQVNPKGIESFIGPGKGLTEAQLNPDLWTYLHEEDRRMMPPMFRVQDPKNINQPWKPHLDLTPSDSVKSSVNPYKRPLFKGESQAAGLGQAGINPYKSTQPVRSSPVAGIPSYTYTPEGREGYKYGLAKGGKVPPSILKGILSLLGSKIPKWLTNLISKTKGGKEYVEQTIWPENIGYNKLMDDLQDQHSKQIIKAREVNEEKMKEALSRLEDSDKMATSMEEEVKRMMDQIEDLNQKVKLLNPDDDDPTYHAKGGIASLAKGGGYSKGLWEAIMKLGTRMGITPREMLKTFIKLDFPISNKLKQKWGIAEADLEFKKPTEQTPTQGDFFLDETMDLFNKFENIDDLKFQKLKNNLKKIKEDNQAMEDAGYRFDDESDEWVKVDTLYEKALKEQTEKEGAKIIPFKKPEKYRGGLISLVR